MKWIAAVVVLAAGCVELGEAQQSSRGDPPVEAGRGDPPPACSVEGWPVTFPLQIELRCGRSVHYENGYESGFLGGIGSLCPDNAATRSALHDAQLHVYFPGTYDACLTVPAGKLFVFWSEFHGPGCPSSCAEGPPPWPL